ncbi:MAG TPA: Asp-tRNA(Asn)/Glu-tRNA(Gln) amidotransferase subunit GatB [Kiloniellales bacterium]
MTLIDGESGQWETVIGLEVHAQVISKAKLFSGAATGFGGAPNSQVSLVDAAMPGMLPVLNRFCVEQAIRTGLGLNARINLHSVFERKNYFYPDLPPGYQISQYLEPIVGNGTITLDLPDGGRREVGIERLHLEQDAGKSLHDRHPSLTYVDLNRAGVALMEIVSKPDLRSGAEAALYLQKLRAILRYLGTCDGNMEEGSLRCDVNVSVRRPGEALGTRTETKNVNSIRFIEQAIAYETRRQIEVLEEGGDVVQETRLFDAEKGVTRPMRTKEEAHDYRYFPDPDLLPLVLDLAWVDEIRAGLPELPDQKKARFMSEYAQSAYNAAILVAEQETANYYEAVMMELLKRINPNLKVRVATPVANWVMVDLFAKLNKQGLKIQDSPIGPSQAAELHEFIFNDTISGRMAKEVFDEMWTSGKSAAEIVEEKGLKQIDKESEIAPIVDRLVADNPKQAEQVRGGNEKVIAWFVGQVMKATQGKANPAVVNRLLRQRLE